MRIALKSLGRIITGNTPSKSKLEYWNSKDIRFVKPDIMPDNKVADIYETKEFISEAARSKSRIVGEDTIFVTCIGSIGKIGIATKGEFAFNQQINALIPNSKVCPKYLAYALLNAKPRLTATANAPIVPIINKSQFGNFEINISGSIEAQTKIVEILDRIEVVIAQQNHRLYLLDELIKSRFVEMFGDTLLNTKGWTENSLESLADIVSGITKGRKVKEGNLTEVPYMAVSNVKDGHIDWTTVKRIMATRQEISQYRLQSNDVLMTEGGDPDKVGRGAIIKNPPINCIHQNHIFRVRLDEGNILPTYFAEYLQHQKAKRYFLGCAKQTTGIASINMRQLKSLPVLLPPLELQNRFAAFVAEVDKSKVAVQKALDEAQLLFDSLMQKYFG